MSRLAGRCRVLTPAEIAALGAAAAFLDGRRRGDPAPLPFAALPPPPPEAGRWFVAVIAAARDYRVRDELARLGADPWLPECEYRRRTRSRTLVRLKGPLFPGYLLVRLAPAGTGWQSLLDVKGVDGLLEHGGRPWPLGAADVVRLQSLVADGGGHILIEDGAIRREFAAGDRVRIDGGPFASWEGLYRVRVGERLKILLDIFNRATETLVEEALVSPA